ncbi:unnamed protein product [Closterium sp. Yama58-4]|nr:unnamed protein product [Closterium sp. Yama58-4]
MARRSSSRGGQAGAFPAALSTDHRGSFRADDAERKAHHPSLHKLPRGARVVLLAGTVIVTLLGFAAFALSGSFRQALMSQLRPSSANPSADLALEVDSTAVARGDAQVAEEGVGEIRAAEGEWVTELRKKPSWRVVSGFQGVPATHLIADSNSLACALVPPEWADVTSPGRQLPRYRRAVMSPHDSFLGHFWERVGVLAELLLALHESLSLPPPSPPPSPSPPPPRPTGVWEEGGEGVDGEEGSGGGGAGVGESGAASRGEGEEEGGVGEGAEERDGVAVSITASSTAGAGAAGATDAAVGDAFTPVVLTPSPLTHTAVMFGTDTDVGTFAGNLSRILFGAATPLIPGRRLHWGDEPHLCFGEVIFPLHTAYSTNATEYVRRKAYAWADARLTAAVTGAPADDTGDAGGAATGADAGADAGGEEEADSEDGEEAGQRLQQWREAEEKRREEQLSKLPSPLQVTWLYRSNRRTITNVGDVLQLLTAHFRMPIHIIELSESTPFDQVVHTMRHTAFAIGMHGSALANLIFLPSGASCLELIPYKYRYFPYLSIAPLFNINYHQWTNEKREFASFDDGCFEGKWAKLSPSDCWKLKPCLRCVRDHARTHVDPESIGPVLADIGREVRIWIGMYGLPGS